MENLIEVLQTGSDRYGFNFSKTYNLNELMDAFMNMLVISGIEPQEAEELKDKFNSRAIVNASKLSELGKVVALSRILLGHTPCEARFIISEYSCLNKIEMDSLLDNLKDIKAMGFYNPVVTAAYLTGFVVPMDQRGVSFESTKDVLKILGIDQKAADELNFTKRLIVYLLTKPGLKAMDDTFNYLLKEGYLRRDIAAAPYILAFSQHKIRGLAVEPPKIASPMSQKVTKLEAIIDKLLETDTRKMLKFFKNQSVSTRDKRRT